MILNMRIAFEYEFRFGSAVRGVLDIIRHCPGKAFLSLLVLAASLCVIAGSPADAASPNILLVLADERG